MVKAMKKEIEIRVVNWPYPKLETIYFGGGTPSILTPALLASLFETIHLHFDVSQIEEITLEANPDDISRENILAWMSLGINRLSIGLQSTQNKRLGWMNRIHTAEQGRSSVLLAQELGIENISLDLMYNFQGSSNEELLADIQSLVSLSPNHISAYGLTIEPKTVFAQMVSKGKLMPMPDDEAASQYVIVTETLLAHGFDQYEISSFCKPGFQAVHNSNYWFQKPYLAIGPGAHGFDEMVRTENLPNNAGYIKSINENNALFQKEEILSMKDIANEMIITRLRTKWGISNKDLLEKTRLNLLQVRRKELKKFSELNHIIIKNETVFLTLAGKLLADGIAMELMF